MKNKKHLFLIIGVCVVIVLVVLLFVIVRNNNWGKNPSGDLSDVDVDVSDENIDDVLNQDVDVLLTRDYVHNYDDLLDPVSGELNLDLYKIDDSHFGILPFPELDWSNFVSDFDVADFVVKDPGPIQVFDNHDLVEYMIDMWKYQVENLNMFDDDASVVGDYSEVYFDMSIYDGGNLVLTNLSEDSEDSDEDSYYSTCLIFDTGVSSLDRMYGYDCMHGIENIFYDNFVGRNLGDSFDIEIDVPDDTLSFGLAGVDDYVGKSLMLKIVIRHIDSYPSVADENVPVLFENYKTVSDVRRAAVLQDVIDNGYPEYRAELYSAIFDKLNTLCSVEDRPVELLDYYVSCFLYSNELGRSSDYEGGEKLLVDGTYRSNNLQDIFINLVNSYFDGEFDINIVSYFVIDKFGLNIDSEEFDRVKDYILYGMEYGDCYVYDDFVEVVGEAYAKNSVKHSYFYDKICEKAVVVDDDGVVVDNLYVADYDISDENPICQKITEMFRDY